MKKKPQVIYKEIDYETIEVVVYLTPRTSSELNKRAKEIKKERAYSLPFTFSLIMKKVLEDINSEDFILEHLSYEDEKDIFYPSWSEMGCRNIFYLSHEDAFRLIEKSSGLIEAYDFSKDFSLSQAVDFSLSEAFLAWNKYPEMYDRFVSSFFPDISE